MIKIQIKSIYGSILFEWESENNTIKETVEKAVKEKADLRSADLRSADLRSANLSSANLRLADLRSADLRSADLSSANLSSANLSLADLRSANLRSANLRSADLRSADLNESTAFLTINCPEEGSFIGWKKAGKELIVKLLITEDALRSSAMTMKCRCSKATVLEIQNIDGTVSEEKSIRSNFDSDFIYEVGKTVEVKDFNTDRWVECSSGIHFFISRLAAVKYN
jgi:hypothetical protein